jgi:hypothetical protein
VSLGDTGHVPGDVETVLDLTVQDFQNISNSTGRISEIGVHRIDGCFSTAVRSDSEFVLQDLKGKDSCLNALI